ncbi:small hydrophilic protein [Streptomyces sp. CS057]|uniref:small hydrophilic protein n=1 Tax=Streptomyces sp. CS057 TaxID=1982764 RepID=UPI000B40A0FA|nr:small hydrophilic protein [Streptomyces sp. CS057]OWA21005.1 small hydrophilic protein [Streptomyces sp. CS057]
MAFSPRLAALAAVVAVPLGIAATSYAMTDTSEAPKVPPTVQLEESPRGTPSPSGVTSPTDAPTPSGSSSPTRTPDSSVVPGPSAADDDDDDDDLGDDG